MKNLFLITAFFLNTTSFAQTVEKAPNTFVRVYDVTYLGDMVAKEKLFLFPTRPFNYYIGLTLLIFKQALLVESKRNVLLTKCR